MDKSKNRTDMLAAGRKKLQQFRQKKDNKGGGSYAKSSSRVAKPGNEGEGEEPWKLGQGTPASTSDMTDANQSDASVSGTDQRAEELRSELEQLPADFENQEADGMLLEKSNVSSSGVGHELNATSPSGVSHEVSGTFSSSEVHHKRGGDPLVSFVNSQAEFSEKDNGGSHEMEKGAPEMEKGATGGQISSRGLHEPVGSQYTNESSVLAGRVQGLGLDLSLSDEMEKDASPEQNLEKPASAQIMYALAAINLERIPVVSGVGTEWISSDKAQEEDSEKQIFEDKLKVTTDPDVNGSTRSAETNQYFDRTEESQDAGMNLTHESNEGTSLEKEMKMVSSSQEISVNGEDLHLELGERTHEGGIEHCFPVQCLSAKDECQGRQPEEDISAKVIVVDAHKAGLPPIKGRFEKDGVLMEGTSAVELESVKKHLYLSYIAKDILQLQLVEQTHLNEDFHDRSSYEVHRLFDLVKKVHESKEMVTEELIQYKSELEFLAVVKDEIESSCLSARKEIEQEHIKCCNLKSELHKSQENLLRVSEELAICRGSVDTLQKENSNLVASLILETHVRKKLVEEVEFLSSEQLKLTAALMEETDLKKKITEERESLSSENMNLLSELTAKEDSLHIALENKFKLQENLRESELCFEQLVEDNFYISCNLDIHKAKIKETESWMFEPIFHGQESQIRNEDPTNCNVDIPQMFHEESNLNVSSSIKLKSLSLVQDHGHLLHKVDRKDSDNYVLLKALKEHLQEAKTKLQDLEKSVQVMHSHSLSLSGSGGMATTAGVSKLIKAFESKAHHVGSGVDEVHLHVGERPEDPYALSIEQSLCLSNTLNRMELELGKVEVHALNNQHNGEVLEKCKMDYETQKYQNNSLQVAFDELAKKVVDYETRVYEMRNHIDELHQRVNEEASGFLNDIEFLKREVSEEVFILKQERDFILGMILEAVRKLDATAGLKVLEDLDTRSHVMASVDATILAIEKLHGKLEETNHKYCTLYDSHEELNKSFIEIKDKHALAIELLYQFYGNLMELIYEAQQNTGDAAMNANVEKVLELLPEKCEMVVNYLRKLLNERVYLLSRNNELDLDLSIRNQKIEELNTKFKELEHQRNIRDGLESTLLNKTKEIEEVMRRCFLLANQLEDHESCKALYAHARSCERGEVVSKYANNVVGSCNSLLFRLEELVSFHLHNYEEILEQIMLSRKHLQDSNMLMGVSADDCFLPLPTLLSQVLIPKVIKLHEKLKLLTVSNVQKETEIQILKEGMSKIEETFEASCHELQLKASEVEQLEQKLSSVREKLSIAVAKGKGLIVQRDSLKQSLMEKTSELEKSTQDLLLKEALLDELETKLKSCSEVERIEALESELSYIRNSATALRDSFLQKDSVLQRIEEVLEDLELPDDFHDKDILEKIELLSRFAINHPPSTLTDSEQKSLEERVHSYAGGRVVMDATKNCMRPGSNPDFDELKRKHEELQGKFYGIAEHNDMLEQSLLERNNLVQKWEEILDRIDLPSHMEPEDKIELLGRELSEVKQVRDSLQLKIDNLEISSDMLIVDVEESHKKISELTAEVVAVKSEKEFFSESLEKLRFEYFALSEKAVHDEQDRENLQNELDDLKDKLIDNTQLECYADMENNLQKIHDLVNSTLTESDKVDFLSGGSLVEHLEVSLKKLIDNYTAHLNKSSKMVPVNDAFLDESSPDPGKMMPDESSPDHGKMVPEETLHDKEADLTSVRLELDRMSNKLISMEQDRDAISVKCQSLMLEIEDLKMQIHVLSVERNVDFEKYHSLVLELDVMGKQRDSLQEQLTQEEQKSVSLKEKLNLAVRKGKGLVQQRDSLKRIVDELNALLEQLKIDHSQQTETLISEKSLLMSQLAEVELNLQDRNQNYSRLLTALHAIDLESEANDIDPVQKLGVVSSILLDMRSSAAAAEREANKSKRASELLLAELNEVQERNDILQDELVKAEASLADYSKQKDDSISRLEHVMSIHLEERARLANNLVDFTSGVDQLREGLLWSSRILPEILSKDVNLLCYMEDLREFTLDEFSSSNRNNQPFFISSNIPSPNDPKNEEIFRSMSNTAQLKMRQHLDETLLFEHFVLADQTLHECMSHCNVLREHISKHSVFLDNKTVYLSESIDAVKRKNSSLKDTSESLKRDITYLESKLKEKDAKISSVYKNLTLLYEACRTSVMETVMRKSQITGNSPTLEEDVGNCGIVLTLPSYANLEDDEDVHSINAHITMMAESILSTVKDTSSTNELVERTERELKATILTLQRELQEKDIQMNRVCEELVSQIRDAEAVAKRAMSDLDSSRAQFSNLEKKAEAVETDRKLLQLRLNELQNVEALSKLLQERINSLTETVNAKDQEIEALMQVLDEEETQMEDLGGRNKDMENLVRQRVMQLETLEVSHAKTMAKLSTTVSKFDELHNLSESLLAEIENLQSQLQERDSEISFLRQEVTRCTNDVLVSQETSKKYTSEVHELLTWVNAMLVSHFGGPPVQFDGQEASQIHLYIDLMGKKIASAFTELEELRATVQCKDALLETERGRVEALLSRPEDLDTSLHGNERFGQSQGGRGSEQQSSSKTSGTLEIEQMVQRNKLSSGPLATLVRSGRKVNNDQIAIAIDSEKDDGVLDDEDDDKAHGFKSLTMSRLVPRATRPIADRIDGIWVSAERLLMRQPTLRLAFLMYWVALHALLASFV